MRKNINEPLLQAIVLLGAGLFFLRNTLLEISRRLYPFYLIAIFLAASISILLYRFFGDRDGRAVLEFKLIPSAQGAARKFREIEQLLSRMAVNNEMNMLEMGFKLEGGSTNYFVKIKGDKIVREAVKRVLFSYKDTFRIRVDGKVGDSLGEYYLERDIKRQEEHPMVAYVLDTGKPAYLFREDFERHVGVFGATGSGKTTTVAVLSALIYRYFGIPVLIFDWHGEYPALLRNIEGLSIIDPISGGIKINPLGHDELESTMNIMDDVLDLSAPQSSFLYRVLREKRPSSLYELLAYLEGTEDRGFWEREVRQAILRKMEFLESPEARMIFRGNGGFSLNRLLSNGITVVDLSKMKSFRLRRLFPLFVLRELYSNALEGGGERKVLVLDEAHIVLPKGTDNFISRMIAEVRKFGVSFIISTQSPSSIHEEFIKNINTFFVHSVKNSFDKEILLASIPGGRYFTDRVSSLRPGEALYSPASSPSPAIVKVVTDILN